MANEQKKSPPPRKPNPNNGDGRLPGNNGGNFVSRNWFWVVLIILVLIGSRFLWNSPANDANVLGLNRVAELVEQGRVERITVQGESSTIYTSNNDQPLRSRKENDQSLLETLRTFGVSPDRLENLPIEIESAPNSAVI